MSPFSGGGALRYEPTEKWQSLHDGDDMRKRHNALRNEATRNRFDGTLNEQTGRLRLRRTCVAHMHIDRVIQFQASAHDVTVTRHSKTP
jgi:hypothetical protein